MHQHTCGILRPIVIIYIHDVGSVHDVGEAEEDTQQKLHAFDTPSKHTLKSVIDKVELLDDLHTECVNLYFLAEK